jgi:hypothetical protein
MKTILMKSIVIGLMFSAFVFASCEKTDKGGCESAVKATIIDLTGLDGCGHVIELENGDRVEPTNLDDFDVPIEDGQEVWVEYHTVEAATICMIGEVVTIDCLSER